MATAAAPPPGGALLAGVDRRRALGLAFTVAVAVIWVGASFVVQGIEAAGAHPAVLTYVANSLFAVYLPLAWAGGRLAAWRRARAWRAGGAPGEADALVPGGGDLSGGAPRGLAPPPAMPRAALARAAAAVAPLWFLAQLAFNASLTRTSVTSNTILSSLSALFTLLLSAAALREALTARKLGCVAALVVGTAMVTAADARGGGGGGGGGGAHGGARTVAGDALVLLSAALYAAYTVLLRRLLGADEAVAMATFFGLMGAMIFCGVGPLLLAAGAAGADLGALTPRALGAMAAKGLADNVLSDYLWARAILLVGPTVATAGLSIQVPLAAGAEAARGAAAWTRSAGAAALTLAGAGAVLGGFLGLAAAGPDDADAERAWEAQRAALAAAFDAEVELDAAGGGGGERLPLSSQPFEPAARI